LNIASDEIQKLSSESAVEERIYLHEIEQKYLQRKKDLYSKAASGAAVPAPVVEDLDSAEDDAESADSLAQKKYDEMLKDVKKYDQQKFIHLIPFSNTPFSIESTPDEQFMAVDGDEEHSNSVKQILDSVVQSLEQDKNRKFTFSNIYFFKRWWNNQNQDKRSSVQDLLANRQLQLIMNEPNSDHEEFLAQLGASNHRVKWLLGD